MPRSAAIAVENSFLKGLVTEAGPLGFPENACTETYNCVFDNQGKVTRRLGLNFEEGYQNKVTARIDDAIEQYLWETVGGNGELNMMVVQVGVNLYFYEVDEEGALSPNLKASSLSIAPYGASGFPSSGNQEACQFASGDGKLFVTHPYCDPFYITYDEDTETFSGTVISIYIRDFEGVEDSLPTDERPTTLTNEHKYNLYNQGWHPTVNGIQWVSHYKTYQGKYPSNSEIWWIFKDINGEYNPQSGPPKFPPTNTPAPKGHYQLKAFYQDRSSVSGITGIPVVTSGYQRPSTVAFFSGRVFYAGVQSEGFGSNIYFTRIVEKESHYGQCYQDNDPTDENQSDLLPSDGGIIRISEIGAVLRLIPIQNSIIVFASNGVWAIQGSEGVGFSAVDYSVRKLSSVESLAKSSFVMVDGSPLWWNGHSINAVQIDPQLGNLSVVSISDDTIKSFFASIPATSKKYVKGAYNPFTRQVQWLYRSTAPTSPSQRTEFDRILCLNTQTGAFFPWSIDTSTHKLLAIGVTKGSGVSREIENVEDESGNVVTNSVGDNVTNTFIVSAQVVPSFRYITMTEISGNSYNMTFSQERDPAYKDWTDTDYTSYFITGYKVHGEAIKKFQTNWMIVYSETEATSSCYLRAVWDFANSALSNRYTNAQQIYNSKDYYGFLTRRLKIRGHGKAVQLRFDSESGKPFNIVGWATFETGNNML